ncbi:hypothetical protein F5Y16DRAFT_338819 [Xylariaceae sp. FL0255]|nr:hypothetical protein F5Y16DRAFT_338819 [Xylariaceae sp. FL0255]
MDAISRRTTAERRLKVAVTEFMDPLTNDQLETFFENSVVPDADSILVFTAELDSVNKGRTGQSVGSRVFKLLQSVRDFCSIIDTIVVSNPEVAALAWGSVKSTMQIAVNHRDYCEAISMLSMDLGNYCPSFADYKTLHQSSKELQESLLDFHVAIIDCCKHIIEGTNSFAARSKTPSHKNSHQMPKMFVGVVKVCKTPFDLPKQKRMCKNEEYYKDRDHHSLRSKIVTTTSSIIFHRRKKSRMTLITLQLLLPTPMDTKTTPIHCCRGVLMQMSQGSQSRRQLAMIPPLWLRRKSAKPHRLERWEIIRKRSRIISKPDKDFDPTISKSRKTVLPCLQESPELIAKSR